MQHPRASIRQAFVATLKCATIAADNVYDSRLYNMECSSLPGIIVYSTQENVVTSTISFPRTQERELKVTVECYVKANKGANSIIDKLAAEVEYLIARSTLLPNLWKSYKLESTDINLNSEGDQPVAVASLVYNLLYITKEGLANNTN